MSIYTQIHSCPLFYDLSKDEILTLISDARVQEFKPGEEIFHEFEQIQFLGIIIKGQISTFKNIDDEQMEIHELKEMEYFGEFLFSNENQHPYGARATQHTSVLKIEFSKFLQYFKKRPEAFGILMMNLLRNEQEKLRISLGIAARVYREKTTPIGLPLFGIRRLKSDEIERIKKKKAS